MNLIIDTLDKHLALARWIETNRQYDASPETSEMERRILACPNKVCADAYRQLLVYMKDELIENEHYDDAKKASIHWKRVGSKCPLCVQTQEDHNNTDIYRKLMRAKKHFQDTFGITGDGGMHLVFTGMKEGCEIATHN